MIYKRQSLLDITRYFTEKGGLTLARLSISSASAGFDSSKAASIAGLLGTETGYDIGVEVQVPQNSTLDKLRKGTHGVRVCSIHAPFMLFPAWHDLGKQFEKWVWTVKLASLRQACMLAKQGNIPIVLHADSILRLAEREALTPALAEGTQVWIENTEPSDALGDAFGNLLKTVQILRDLDQALRVRVNYDLGHAALAAFRAGSWTGELGTFAESVLDPQMCKLQELDAQVTALHIHNFDPHDYSDKPDHKRLERGTIPVDKVIRWVCQLNPNILLTLEVSYLPGRAGYVLNSLVGYGDNVILSGARKDLGVIIDSVPEGCSLIRAALK